MGTVYFGVDVGGTTVKIGLFSAEGQLEDKWEIVTRTDNSGEYILGDIAASIAAKIQEKNLTKENVGGIGIGIPGPITEDGTVLKCANLGWDVFNVADELSKLTGIKNVKVGNDANVAALGEMWKGGGKGYKDVIMVTLGTGVGGGVILNGKILTGSNGAAGEIGHLTVNYDEPDTCGCGKKGCLEQFASATGIVKQTGRILAATDKTSKLREMKDFTAKDIFDLAKDGDELCMESVEELGRYLGIACSHVAAVVDPQVFVIGGGVSRAGSILIDVIKKNYESNVMFALKNKEFKLAELGNDAGMYGCVKMVLD